MSDRPALLAHEKEFYARFWALHADPVLVDVFQQFGPEPFRRSSVLEGFDAFLRAQRVRGRRCVEIGTWKGLTAIVLARYFDEVVSIDVLPDGDRARISAHCGVSNARFVTIKSGADKVQVIEDLGAFDFAYVDGDHANDTVSDFDLVKRCGRVLFHEYWEAQPAVWSLVNGLRACGQVVTSGKLALWTAND